MYTKDLARNWFEIVWNQRNPGAISSLLDDNAVGITEGSPIQCLEQFKVGKKAFPGALRGVVKTISFWGSYYEIEILQEGGAWLIARSTENELAAGDTVFILPPWDGVWYL